MYLQSSSRKAYNVKNEPLGQGVQNYVQIRSTNSLTCTKTNIILTPNITLIPGTYK